MVLLANSGRRVQYHCLVEEPDKGRRKKRGGGRGRGEEEEEEERRRRRRRGRRRKRRCKGEVVKRRTREGEINHHML